MNLYELTPYIFTFLFVTIIADVLIGAADFRNALEGKGKGELMYLLIGSLFGFAAAGLAAFLNSDWPYKIQRWMESVEVF